MIDADMRMAALIGESGGGDATISTQHCPFSYRCASTFFAKNRPKV